MAIISVYVSNYAVDTKVVTTSPKEAERVARMWAQYPIELKAAGDKLAEKQDYYGGLRVVAGKAYPGTGLRQGQVFLSQCK